MGIKMARVKKGEKRGARGKGVDNLSKRGEIDQTRGSKYIKM